MFTDLSGKWQVYLDEDKSGELPAEYGDEISLPDSTSHAGLGRLNEERKYGCLTDIYKFEGHAWFRRTVSITEEQSGRELTLFLERTRKTAVFLDGEKVGEYCSLCTPHRYSLGSLAAGEHELIIRVDNTDYPTSGGHLTSQDTQTNWNGITGRIGLTERGADSAYADSVSVCSDIGERTMRICAGIAGNGSGRALIRVLDENGEYGTAEAEYTAGQPLECTVKLSENTPTWSEHSPALLRLEIDTGEVSRFAVGFRQFTAEGLKLRVNGLETFLRGKHDGLVFPKTGFAPTDTASWIKVFETAKRYGINHYRFHTCCPPQAAFEAADFIGIYLEPELPFWGTIPDELTEEHIFLREEGFRILREFGHHPSFVMMSMGNELWGSKERLEELLAGYRAVCPDKLYVQGSNNFQFVPCVLENDDVFSGVRFARERLIRGSYASCDAPFGHIQTDEPNSIHNYDPIIIPKEQKYDESAPDNGGEIMIQYGTEMKKVSASDSGEIIPNLPVISHEVGQYYIYPNYDEISKYCGSLRHCTYEDYRETARERGLLPYAADFFKASGALSAACYRSEIETALRSELMSGFQLLDLQDFPGQGIATVGILDPFMDSKGIIEPSDWRKFCGKTVVLAELEKFIFTAGERIECGLLVSSTDPNFSGAKINWTVTVEGRNAASGASAFRPSERRKRIYRADNIGFSVDCGKPCTAELSLRVDGSETVNSYKLYIYPEIDVEITESSMTYNGKTVPIVRELPKNGADVRALYIPDAEEDSLRGEYCTDFWCYGMFRSISESMGKPVPTGTLGLLIDRESDLLRGFPCEKHTTPQWYGIVSHSHCAKLPGNIVPDVWVIDNPQRAERLALLYRYNGAAVCTSRLWEIADRIEVKHFAASLVQCIADS